MVLNLFKEAVLMHNHSSPNKFKKSKNLLPRNCHFFHENHKFFEVFEIAGIDSSLILKYLKNPNQQFFKNSKN
jgi:hypothetical protein